MVQRVDVEEIKRRYPVEDVAERYGITLRASGRALLGRCPFHADGGRPNLFVYPASRSFYCYNCGAGGDVITFVERIEDTDWWGAIERLTGERGGPVLAKGSAQPRPAPLRRNAPRSSSAPWGPVERACLTAAVDVYHNRLMGDPLPSSYVQKRGVGRPTLERYRVGYSSGDELMSYLRWRNLPAQAAFRTGLLGHGGRETMAGRVVVAEIRSGQPIWMVGRAIAAVPNAPKYLGLPGRKPLLGWEDAATSRTVVLVEGVFDWLVLRSWGWPAIALTGTHGSAAAVNALARFDRVYLALDSDRAGQEATRALTDTLGSRAVPVVLAGVKDVADLALRPDGAAAFARAMHDAEPSGAVPAALAA